MKDQNQNARDEQMYAYASWMSKHGGFAKDMTLRDHFAGLAMQVLIANDETSLGEDANDAYMVADAMLKARGK